jgi:hypothetical protein
MCAGHLKAFKITFLWLFLFTSNGYALPDTNHSHVVVAMRMIGHRVLLQAGDSTSLVLPVITIGNRYSIQLGAEVGFNPDTLRMIIDSTLKNAAVADGYIVEVKTCSKHEVVYSYEIGDSVNTTMIPCGMRTQPRGCYLIDITLSPASSTPLVIYAKPPVTSSRSKAINYILVAIVGIVLLIIVCWLIYFRDKKPLPVTNSEMFFIGEYRFDKKNMTLEHKNEKTELSSKEADLLFLLFNSENKTLERDYILKTVWGNDGDYMGRTLDVFISRLRKKLEADAHIKIINVRGVGYKLILNGVE